MTVAPSASRPGVNVRITGDTESGSRFFFDAAVGVKRQIYSSLKGLIWMGLLSQHDK